MVQFLASNTFVTNPAKIQMVGRDRDRGRFPERRYSSSLAAQLLRQIVKLGDKLRVIKSTSCAITLLTKTEAFP
jgi:hypothetical protein